MDHFQRGGFVSRGVQANICGVSFVGKAVGDLGGGHIEEWARACKTGGRHRIPPQHSLAYGSAGFEPRLLFKIGHICWGRERVGGRERLGWKEWKVSGALFKGATTGIET